MEEIIWIMVLMSAGISVGVLTVRFLVRSRAAHAFYDVLRIVGTAISYQNKFIVSIDVMFYV